MAEERKPAELQNFSFNKKNPEVKKKKKRKKKPGINLAGILRKRKRKEEIPVTGKKEIDKIISALWSEPDLFDFVVRNGTGEELYRFYFIGTGNLKMLPGRKVTQNLVHYACPECGCQSPIIVIQRKLEIVGRTTGEKIITFRTKKATIHCGKLQNFED